MLASKSDGLKESVRTKQKKNTFLPTICIYFKYVGRYTVTSSVLTDNKHRNQQNITTYTNEISICNKYKK